jgi:hypothetical protein
MEGSTTGAMKLTVTGKNLIPLMSEINIVNSNVLLGIDHLDIIDTNSGTTSGNADSMLSPAETVELRISVKNFGTSTTATGITSLLSATSPRVTIIQGSSIIPNLTPGSSSIAVFRISLAPTLIVTDTLGLSLHLSSAQGNWDQTVWAEISDAEFIPLSYQYTPVTLEPGGEANLIITLNNSGLCNASNIIANLTSLDPLIQILSNNSAFGSIFSGDTGSNSSHPFSLGASSSAYSGRLSHLRLNFNTLEGYTPVSDLFIQVGTVNVSDPMGPDDYGYYCFDSGDTGYTQAPIYSWYDIHSVGTQLMLPDYNDEQDCRVLVNLPFTFTYYGENYTQISVCSNGFISMGNNDYVYFRNKAIPSAMGPPAMIAAFWDDLQMIMFGFDGKVYKYYQSSLHRFVIEYYNVKNDFSSVNECFEIMLYDPAYYPTPTGDGEIVFQYQDVHDYDTNDNYCTVGIEDYYHTTGLQYVFSAIYPPSSDTLADGLAIKFSTNPGQYTSAQLSLSFNPVNPPIIIPASGGSFSFTAGITNISSSPTTFDFWTEAVLPDGNTMSPIFLRTNLSLSAGASINRTLSQTIPAAAPPGQYLFRGLIGDHNTGNVLQYQEFNFTKLGSQ